MGKLAVIETEAGPVRLSGKGRVAFETLCDTGGHIKIAAQISGLHERSVRRLLTKPGVRALMRQRARETVARAAPMAANRLQALAQQDDARKVSLEAAVAILGIEGIKPPAASPTINVGVGVQVGYVIDLTEPDERPRAGATVIKGTAAGAHGG